MVFVNVSIRDVDPKVFREFKAKTVTQGTKTGTAVTQALKEWTQKNEEIGIPGSGCPVCGTQMYKKGNCEETCDKCNHVDTKGCGG